MKKIFFCILSGFLVILPSILPAATLLEDDFSGNIVNSDNWSIPARTSPTDGTLLGRTQMKCAKNFVLPSAGNGNALITVETYNPTGSSFYGTDLLSKESFSLDQGIHITVRAKMDKSAPGLVGGICLYASKPGFTASHDEINFEFFTNRPHGIQTNICAGETTGTGHPQFISYNSGSITDYHTYEITWRPNEVSWFVDGDLVRTDISHVPTGPMQVRLNIWAPDSDQTKAYSSSLQPTLLANDNQIFGMSVDSVAINSLHQAPAVANLAPILFLLMLGDGSHYLGR